MHYADMHIHSLYSDGTLSPAQIVQLARGNGVGLISVCDHNVVQGTLEVLPLAKAAGLECVCGVEIDAIFEDTDVHILCYGADLENEALLERIRHARRRLDQMSEDLLDALVGVDSRLSRAEYEALPHDTSKGGWKLLQYLTMKGVIPFMKAGFPLYDQYGVTYAAAGFDTAETVIRAIHAAGGRAVLAHPGVTFSVEHLGRFEAQVERIMDLGLDGIECHYVRHPAGITRSLRAICDRRGCMITAGSDCHGAFSGNEIGQTKTPIGQLRLNGLEMYG